MLGFLAYYFPSMPLYTHQNGALPLQRIRTLMNEGIIKQAKEDHLQPSSLDLSLSGEVYRMRGSFLPQKGESIRDIIKTGNLFRGSLEQPLELFGIYLIRLQESFDLPQEIYAYANNKSSSGRVNVQTRVLVDGVSRFDKIPNGYKGELWLEVIPKSFPVKFSEGERLNQTRFFTGDSRLSGEEHRRLNAEFDFLCDKKGQRIDDGTAWGNDDGITMTIDLLSDDIVGFRCSPTTCRMLDYKDRNVDPTDFFEPIYRPKDGQVVMRRGEFYIFCTKEGLRIPPNFAAEMIPYDPSHGEFRSHYAGFFDPGWGYGDGTQRGTEGVLEVFTHDNDFVLRDGQPICKMVYERLVEPAEVIYGQNGLGSHYSHQTGPRLSKHFAEWK